MNEHAAPQVLIVDDEEPIQRLVEYNLRRAGFLTEVIGNGREAYEAIQSGADRFDIVILDLMLPEMDGMEICRKVRQANLPLPIILLTAKDEEIDRILGLEIGADDYVTKPFSPRELVARVKAVLRRTEMRIDGGNGTSGIAEVPFKVGDIVMDPARHEVSVRGTPIDLTPKEFELLRYFLVNSDRVLSRDRLLDEVWGYSSGTDTRIVDVHISHLREKIEDDPKTPLYLRTVRGIGYKFTESGAR